jgi:hypothetical protein
MSKAILVDEHGARVLEPVPVTRDGAKLGEGGYNEAWLQDLIQAHPDILPIGEIEPGFGALIPVAREVACGHGYIDNLFVTAEGGVAVVETKLWRNPEARREVVAQALDYAAALGRMSYAEFEAAALGGVFAAGVTAPRSLFALVAETGEAPDESAFIDAVTTNLRRGRMLIVAAGDGIRTETETLAGLLQSHAGARFTFALVAIELFKDGERIFAVPRQLAKTVMIERGVVSILDDRAHIAPAPMPAPQAGAKARLTMTQELFMETIAKCDPKLPGAIRQLFERVAPLGVYPHWGGALNLRWPGWPEGDVNLGVISKEGLLWTDPTNWKVGADRALQYHTDLAAAFGGVVRDVGNGGFLASANGKGYVPIAEILPDKLDAWVAAMERFVGRLRAEAASREA